jgi:UDP:flavonoid glycosyltransferase YjiC (YdhE family)
MIGVAGGVGHAFPAFSLGRALRARGHEVLIETFERWREVVEGMDIRFSAGVEKVIFPGPPEPGEEAPGFAQAVRGTVPLFREFEPEVVVADLFGIVPAVAAELDGVRTATLIPHTWPGYGSRIAPWSWGLLPPRTPFGPALWRTAHLFEAARRRRGKLLLDRARVELGLPPKARAGPTLSDELVMVATFPQLEYPIDRPAPVHVTGPMLFELPYGEVELPPGAGPLVLVAASTGQDLERDLLGATLDALADEPVRVLATVNERGARWPGDVPENARVVDWISYARVLPRCAAVVTRGGHGTIARALAEGVPVLACPTGGDQPENGSRVAWSGAGLMLPRRFVSAGPIRWAIRRLLGEPSFATRAREIAAWGRENDGAERGAELIERQLAS